MLPTTLAIFDDTTTLASDPTALYRYAIIKTTPYEGCVIFRSVPHATEVLVVETSDTSSLGCHRVMAYPGLERLRTLIWNTGWIIQMDGENIPIIDLECRVLNKNFNFTVKRLGDTMQLCRARQSAQRNIRLSAMQIGVSHFMEPGILPLKIPTFVAKLMKDDLIRKEEACPITSVRFQVDIPTAITACFHSFDPEALQAWLRLKKECPTCRSPVMNTTII